MNISLTAIKQQGVKELCIHSFESGIYLVTADMHQHKGFVTDENGRHLQFKSVHQATQALNTTTAPIWLVEETAYDEMCGSSERHDAPMRIPVRA